MKIKLLKRKSAKQYRMIRLEALQKHPNYFASSYEDEKKLTASKYESRFSNPVNSFTFGVFDGNQ